MVKTRFILFLITLVFGLVNAGFAPVLGLKPVRYIISCIKKGVPNITLFPPLHPGVKTYLLEPIRPAPTTAKVNNLTALQKLHTTINKMPPNFLTAMELPSTISLQAAVIYERSVKDCKAYNIREANTITASGYIIPDKCIGIEVPVSPTNSVTIVVPHVLIPQLLQHWKKQIKELSKELLNDQTEILKLSYARHECKDLFVRSSMYLDMFPMLIEERYQAFHQVSVMLMDTKAQNSAIESAVNCMKRTMKDLQNVWDKVQRSRINNSFGFL